MVGIEKLPRAPQENQHPRLTRRATLGGALAGLATAAGLGAVSSVAAADEVDGIAGGGVVTSGAGDTQFSLAVVHVPRDGQDPLLTGAFVLNDPNAPDGAVLLHSVSLVEFTAYSTERPHARQIVGWATINSAGSYPFLLRVEDTTAPGAGEDTFNLVLGQAALPFLADAGHVCDCGQYSYSLRGPLTSGDLTTIADLA
ncbi:MAG: hypothetical protein H0W06_10150 [Chloroflexia bacterium]|nr:hypothetical protein [Chloroflexia bacterium]